MKTTRSTAAAALASITLLAPTGAALAHDRDHGQGPPEKTQARQVHGNHPHAVPQRMAAQLRAAQRAVRRAGRHAARGHEVAAVAALRSARRHLRVALKTVGRRGDGAATAAAQAAAYGRLAEMCIEMLDGAPDGLDGALAETLARVLDVRDELVAGIAELPDAASYGDALQTIVKDSTDELQTIATLLASGRLTDPARAALEAAQTQVTAAALAATQAGGNAAAA